MPLRRSSSTSTGITLVNTSSTANTPSSIVGNPYKKLTSTAQAVNIILGKISGATSGTKSDENSEIWNATLKDQINKLKPKDRKFCGPIRLDATLDEKTLAQIFTPLSIRYDKGLFQRLVKRIGPIADHVLSFGKAVDIAVGGGPLAAGLIWGGIRILLAVGNTLLFSHSD
jgi:hypothetical protein